MQLGYTSQVEMEEMFPDEAKSFLHEAYRAC